MLKYFSTLCFILFSIFSCRENNSPQNTNVHLDICSADDHVLGIKMLVYSLLIDHLGRDTVFILDKKIPTLDNFQSINNKIDSFWQRLPFQPDTTSENMYVVKGNHTIDCLTKLHFDKMVVKTINEKELALQFSRKHNNICLQISDYYVFKKEGFYGLVVHQMSDTLNVSNFYLISEGNNYLRYTSNNFDL